MDLKKIIIAGKTRNYSHLNATEIAMAKKMGGGGSATIVPFSTGTDDEIVAMIRAAHAGSIDLQTDGGWAIGDTRTINIASFTAGGNTSEPQQDIDIVITSFDEYMSCGNVLQFDFKDALSTTVRMNASNSNTGGYGASELKTVTIPALVEALPAWLKGSLIEFSVLSSAGGGSSTIETVTGNKLALRAEAELFSGATYSTSGEGSNIGYYDSRAKRTKNIGHSGTAGGYWERSPYSSGSTKYCNVNSSGNPSYNDALSSQGVAPFGCL